MLKIQKLRASDVQDTAWEIPDFAEIRSMLQADHTVFAVFSDSVPAGLLLMQSSLSGDMPHSIYADRICIRADFRRKGIGRMLMAVAAGFALDCDAYFILSRTPDTPEGMRFAEAIHLRPCSALKDVYLLDLTDVEGLRHG